MPHLLISPHAARWRSLRRVWLGAIVCLFLLGLVPGVGQAADPTQTQAYILQTVWGGPAQSGTFLYPEGLDLDAQGRVYIADRGNDRVQILGANGSLVDAWGSRGSAPRQ